MTEQPTPPRILPPHWFLMALLAILAISVLEPDPLNPQFPRVVRWLGLPLIAGGVWLAMAGSRLFARAGTNIVPLTRSTTLVTCGVFRISRNPMYLGMILTLAGTALLAQTLIGWLVVVSFSMLIRQRFVLREEALLRSTFGDAYAAYCSNVRRWI